MFVTADDLLPESGLNAMRSVTDAEVVTLAVAQAMMNIVSDREFLAVARQRLGHLFPKLPPSLSIGNADTAWPTRSSG